MIVQLEEDELIADKYLSFFAELIEFVCGPLASYSLSRRSPVQSELSTIITNATELFFKGSLLPPLLYPQRVFLSNQLYKSTVESLQKVWMGNNEFISALICKSKKWEYIFYFV